MDKEYRFTDEGAENADVPVAVQRIVGLLREIVDSSRQQENEHCIYCGDSIFDPHRCTSGGSHDFEPTGEGYYLVESELVEKLKMALLEL